MKLTEFEKSVMIAALVLVVGIFCWSMGSGNTESYGGWAETNIELVINEATGEEAEKALVNINTAVSEELQTLSGIGEELAQRIIDYRTENGPFRAIEELLNVSGIGEKKLEAFEDEITVGYRRLQDK